MKFNILLTSILLCTFSQQLFAEFQTWTSADGRSAELDLISSSEEASEKIGTFKTRTGSETKLKASQLSEADAKKLNDFKSAEKETTSQSGSESVFDKLLDGNLLTLQDKKLKRFDGVTRPAKYYLFYYTASWCPPCQKFTPKLVEFYNANKGNKDFEIVLITSDRSEDDMEAYAIDKKMLWKHLKYSKVEDFSEKFNHPGSGIPNLVLTDLKGELIKTSYIKDEYQGPSVVMEHLASLIQK